MPIKRISNFLESDDLGITHSLGIESDQLSACIKEIRDRNIQGAFGCPVFGFKEEDLDFFHEIPFIRQVWFWEIKLKDIAGLYALEGLEYFGVSEKRPSIDFSRFPSLRKAVWHPIRNDSGLGDLGNLEELDIWRFKPKAQSYSDLEIPNGLRKLDLNWCSPTTLDEMPVLPNLEELQFHYCRNLESIDSVLRVAPNIKRLVITRCPNLSDYNMSMKLIGSTCIST